MERARLDDMDPNGDHCHYDLTLDDSEDSRPFSDTSYSFQYDSYDDDEDYYKTEININSDDDIEAVPVINLDVTEPPVPRIMEDAGDVETIEESFEENNNDPNNNMDSIETVSFEEARPEIRSFPIESETNTISGTRPARDLSPIPGCSKDSILIPEDQPDKGILLEKTRHLLGLISQIHRDSIYDAIQKNHKKPVSQWTLWDLIPEAARREYPDDIFSYKSENGTGTSTKSNTTTNGIYGAKRGSEEDIRIVGPKRSKTASNITKSAILNSKSSFKVPSSTAEIMILSSGTADHTRQHSKQIPQGLPIIIAPPRTSGATATITTAQGAIAKVYNDPGSKYGNQGKGKMSSIVTPAATASTSTGIFSNVHFVKADRHNPFPTMNVVRLTQSQDRGQPQSFVQDNDGLRDELRKGLNEIKILNRINQLSSMPLDKPDTITSHKNQRDPPHQQVDLNQAIQETVGADAKPHEQNVKRAVCMEMYYKLINMFPNVDRDYIKKLCPPAWGNGDKDAQLAPLIDHILAKGDEVPMIIPNEIEDPDEMDGKLTTVDEIYENLLGIFPDADPHYLREAANQNVGKPDGLKNFVESKFEKRDYPTREQYMARLEITEQQRQYTHGFDVKQYLSIIPDPMKLFMDSERMCKYDTVAFEFLKSHFNKNRVSTVSSCYRKNWFNLSRTANNLELVGSDMRNRRANSEMLTENISLLQEIAFVKHKRQIQDYIANIKKMEDDEFKTLQAQNKLLECQCCYDNECIPSKCSECDNGHIFCNNCVVTGTSTKMGDGETRIHCFANCGSEFSLSVLQRVLAPTTFSILLKKRQAAEVIEAGLDGLVSCPFCHFASIPPEGDKIFKCLNPECTKESCRLCKELSHVPLKCDEVMHADKARRYIEEKMTEALARKCYKCQKSFFKEEGCNKITCVCGAMQCYLCDQPIKDYKHFRGQGSDDKNLCPLYSDTIRLDAVAVRKVAEEAQAAVMKCNPNVKIDTAGLLPDIPRPRVGPHQDVLNADEMPRRVQRPLDLPQL